MLDQRGRRTQLALGTCNSGSEAGSGHMLFLPQTLIWETNGLEKEADGKTPSGSACISLVLK